MGVFMILCLVVFPFYQKTDDTHKEQQSELRIPLSVVLTCRHEYEKGKFFILHDANLIVEQKIGNTRVDFSGEHTQYNESAATHLGYTHVGQETWLHPAPENGTYSIVATIEPLSYNVFDNLCNPYLQKTSAKIQDEQYQQQELVLELTISPVQGKVEKHDKRIRIRDIQKGQPVRLADISVSNDGLHITYID